jgi:hypothetical protein
VSTEYRSDLEAVLGKEGMASVAEQDWRNATRFDAGVHLRNQFSHFERKSQLDDPAYMQEVAEWLSSEECSHVFSMIRDLLISHLTSEAMYGTSPKYRFTVFVAGDNDVVKKALRQYLETTSGITFAIVTVPSNGIVHIGAESHAHEEDVLKTLSLDWYLLSLCNTVLGWRIGGTNMQSTFLHSAQRMGSYVVTNCSDTSEVPSTGFVLERNSRTQTLIWYPMFQYGKWDVDNL